MINLHQINHVFKKGNRVIVQVQSSWFQIIDQNPQKYVANIFEAEDGDFVKAEEGRIMIRPIPRVALQVMS